MAHEEFQPCWIGIDDQYTIYLDKAGAFTRFIIQAVGTHGIELRLSRAKHQELLDALEYMVEDADGQTRHPAQGVKSYRGWFYWIANVGTWWYPKVDHPDAIAKPVTLPICDSHEAALASCKAHIDKQLTTDDGPAVIS